MANLREDALTQLKASGIQGADAETGLDSILRLVHVEGTDDLRSAAELIPVDPETQRSMFGSDAMRHAHVLRSAHAAD